jgi:hypothetical protein
MRSIPLSPGHLEIPWQGVYAPSPLRVDRVFGNRPTLGSPFSRTSVLKEIMMKANGRAVSFCIFILAAVFVGCGKSNVAPGTSGVAAGASTALQSGASVVNQLGGMSNVLALADSFGLHISKHSVVGQARGAAGIASTKEGFVNEIAKASGMKPPTDTDLFSTLKDNGIDEPAEVDALTAALSAAADEMKLTGPVKTAVLGVLTPITSKLVG